MNGPDFQQITIEKCDFLNQSLAERFLLREVHADEGDEVARIEQICFPPHEACTSAQMRERVAAAPELFLVAVERENGRIAGFLNGLATDETVFRDAFFEDAGLHRPDGRNIMLLGLDVLPEYRGQGLAREIMFQYLRKERDRNREIVLLTCLESKVKMYEKMGFQNRGIANSNWGNEQWYEMSYTLHIL